MRFRAATLLTVSAILAAFTVAPASASAGCPGADTPPILSSFSLNGFGNVTLCLLNEERAKHGLAPLVSNGQLASAASTHSSSMRWHGFFSHTGLDGSSPEDRIAASGYLASAIDFNLGENLAWGHSLLGTPRALHVAWMNSPGHRANMLDPVFREVGIGVEWGSPIDPYMPVSVIITHDFGTVTNGIVDPPTRVTHKKAKAKKAKRSKKAKKKRRKAKKRRGR
jgi:uncharacterized protein YkwD